MLDSATQSLVPDSDRQAFEQAGKEPGFVFPKQGDISVERIKQSKYFKALIQHSKGSTRIEVDERVKQEDTNGNISKVPLYGKPRGLYGSLSGKHGSMHNNGVEGRGLSTYIDVDEERTNGSSFRSKRAHVEISSPKNIKVESPSSNGDADADVTGNNFVTARTKLEMDVGQRKGLASSSNPSVSPQSDGANRGYGVKSFGARRGIRGFVPPIDQQEFLHYCQQVTHGAIQFTAYEELRKVLVNFRSEQSVLISSSAELLTSMDYATLGASSKLAAIIVTYPIHVINVMVIRARLQQRPSIDGVPRYVDSWHVMKKTARLEGLNGFYKGMTANLLKNLPSASLTFVVYENILNMLTLEE